MKEFEIQRGILGAAHNYSEMAKELQRSGALGILAGVSSDLHNGGILGAAHRYSEMAKELQRSGALGILAGVSSDLHNGGILGMAHSYSEMAKELQSSGALGILAGVSSNLRSGGIMGALHYSGAYREFGRDRFNQPFIHARDAIDQTVENFGAGGPSGLHASDLAALYAAERFAVVSSQSAEAIGVSATLAVDGFGVASLLLRTDGSFANKQAVSELLQDVFVESEEMCKAAFSVRKREAKPAILLSLVREEDPQVRNKRAYACLLSFEIKLRRFIAERMEEEFGEGWMRARVPEQIYSSWERKKRAALDKGRPDEPLINFADFTDYVQIIDRTDNWRDIFGAIFRRRESVRESLVRLHPIRIDAMHARIVSEDDEIWLEAEVRRVMRDIDR